MEDKKYRHEFKYLCSEAQIAMIQNRINNLLKIDSHTIEQENTYNVRSLYLDDYYNTYYYENESGVDPREKIRIRIYNNSDERISLEIKQKQNGKTYKKSEIITRDIVEDIIKNKLQYHKEYGNVLKKVWFLNRQRLLKPAVIVDYERIPYVYKQGNVRITIDKNISSSKDFDNFFEKDISKRPINQLGYHILEVKFDEFLPDYIYGNLQIEHLKQMTYSKYYLCRRYSL